MTSRGSLSLIAAGMLSGVAVYFGMIPIEAIVHPVRIRATGLDVAIDSEMVARGLSVVAFAMIGTLVSALTIGRLVRPCRNPPDSEAASLGLAAWGSVFLLALTLPISGILWKAADIRTAQSANASSFLIAFHSIVLTVSASLCGLACGHSLRYAWRSARSLLWLVLAAATGALGLLAGDKNALGGAVLGVCFGLVMGGASLPTMGVRAIALVSAAMFASGPVNAFKFRIFGVDSDLVTSIVPPSRLDPSTPFAITVAAFDELRPIGIEDFNAMEALFADAAILVPRALKAERRKAGAVTVAEYLMGSDYFDGAGFGYSPYVDLIALVGPLGALLGAFAVTSVLICCQVVACSFIGPSASSAASGLLGCVAVLAQRMSLFGAFKVSVYATGILVASLMFASIVQRVPVSKRAWCAGRKSSP